MSDTTPQDPDRDELISDLVSADQGWHLMDDSMPDDRDHLVAVADGLLAAGWRKTPADDGPIRMARASATALSAYAANAARGEVPPLHSGKVRNIADEIVRLLSRDTGGQR